MPAVIAFRAGDQERLRKKLDAKYLVEPEFDDIFKSAETRVKRTGKGIAAKRNTITFVRTDRLSAKAITTLAGPNAWKPKPRKGPVSQRKGPPRPGWQEKIPNFNPRTSGVAWDKYNENVLIKNILPRSIAKAVKNIEARWAAS